MRILVAIPHYYRAEEVPTYGSLDKDPAARIAALTETLLRLQQTFQSPHGVLHAATHSATPANHSYKNQIDIVICTTDNHHVLDKLPIKPGLYRHEACSVPPRLLGFECQTVLKEHFGRYDYYCFMEDDLVIRDPWFFLKLQWFNRQVGNPLLLQPNRFEVSGGGLFTKGYIDGEISEAVAAPYQNVREKYEMGAQVIGEPIKFRRTTNPHSGCYFLNSEQMEYWLAQPHYLDRDVSFVDPMASAATLGILKTFTIYKPAIENADFFEIEHMHRRYIWLAGDAVSVDKEAFAKAGFQAK